MVELLQMIQFSAKETKLEQIAYILSMLSKEKNKWKEFKPIYLKMFPKRK